MQHRPVRHRQPSREVPPRLRWSRLLRLLRWFGGRRTRPEAPSRPARAAVPTGRVDHVVDPDGGVLLFRIVGEATLPTVWHIDRITAALDARHAVHLDLFDATITSAPVVRELERLADRLERSMVTVRMAGVDPNHPVSDAR